MAIALLGALALALATASAPGGPGAPAGAAPSPSSSGGSGSSASVDEGWNQAVVVVDTGNEVKSACVRFREASITGIDLLRAGRMDPEVRSFSGNGAAVCKLCGVGCSAGNQCLTCQSPLYWQYHRAPSGSSSYTYAEAGAGSTQVRDGDVDGWAWADDNDPPPFLTVASVCSDPSRTYTFAAEPPPSTTAPPPPRSAPPASGSGGSAGGSGSGSSGGPTGTGGSEAGPSPSSTPPRSSRNSGAVGRSSSTTASPSGSGAPAAGGAEASAFSPTETTLAVDGLVGEPVDDGDPAGGRADREIGRGADGDDELGLSSRADDTGSSGHGSGGLGGTLPATVLLGLLASAFAVRWYRLRRVGTGLVEGDLEPSEPAGA